MLSQTAAKQVLVAGLSVILGYSIFVALFHNKCANLLIHKRNEHNATLQSVSKVHEAAVKQACHEDSIRFMRAQTIWTSQYQELKLQQEHTLEQLNNATQQKDGYDEMIRKLNEQVRRLQRELGSATVQVRQVQRASQQEVELLRQQLDLSRSLIQQKVDEVRSITSEGSCPGCDPSELIRIQASIARRNAAQCAHWLGAPPYVVEFTLQDALQERTSFHVEFTDLSDMPHTIWTFLSLVNEGLYDGTTLHYLNTDRGPAVTGGEPHSGPKHVHSFLQRKYATAGYGSEPLLFEELSPAAPCWESTFGFVGRGPSLLFPLESYRDGGRFGCPGSITSGRDILQQIQQTGQSVTIQSVRIVNKLSKESAKLEL